MKNEIILPSLWGIKRYSQTSFPPYRFVPGTHPHPTEHPEGHSFQKNKETLVLLTEENWHTNKNYLYGIDLYNYCFWWEAHEAWEGLWGETKKGETASDFLQGLIQISAAFLKWHMKEKRGVQSLFKSGYAYLEKTEKDQSVYMGLDLTGHLGKLRNYFTVDRIENLPSPFIHYPAIILKDF